MKRSARPRYAPRVVVITGASSGIGRATARAFAADGAYLVLAARGEESLHAVEQECRAVGATTLVAVADVADEHAVDAVRVAAVRRFGHVDVWVHSAAVVAYGRFEDVPSQVFRRVVDTDVHGTVYVARAALRQFRGQGYGTLVLVGSLLGEIATPYMSGYVTSKWAVRGLARVLAIETRGEPDIHVCMVSPGGVDTPVYVRAANYAGRIGRPPPPVDPPEKVARVIVATADRPRPRRSVGLANPVIRAGFTAMPGVYDTLVTPLMKVSGLSRHRTPPHEGNVFAPQASGGDRPEGQWGRHWLRGVGAAVAAGASAAGVVALRARAWKRPPRDARSRRMGRQCDGSERRGPGTIDFLARAGGRDGTATANRKATPLRHA